MRKKTFITPEIPSSFSQSLKELALFQDSDIITTADWVGHVFGNEELLSQINKVLPDLVITTDKVLVSIIHQSSKCKIFLLTEGHENLVQLWVFQLKVFLNSQSQVFTV